MPNKTIPFPFPVVVLVISLVLRVFSLYGGENRKSQYADHSSILQCPLKPEGTVTDVDGNIYPTIRVGNQIWLSKNLEVTHYSNGDEIPYVEDLDVWRALTTGAWCYYQNKTENGVKFGKLYNWYAANDPRGIAPKGWHVPTLDEWKNLTKTIGKENIALKLKSLTDWGKKNKCCGNNESGFNALPGCSRLYDGFYGFGTDANWWTFSPRNPQKGRKNAAYYTFLGCYAKDITFNINEKEYGYSIRCVKNESANDPAELRKE